MAMIITEQTPNCKASGGDLSKINNLINSIRTTGEKRIAIKTEIKILIQSAFEAGIEYQKGRA